MLSKPSPDADKPSAATPPVDKPPADRPPQAGASSLDEERTFVDATARGASVIRPEATIEGNISGGDEILVDGVVKGDIRFSHVIVGRNGRVEGGIYADLVEVRGRVTGAISGKQVKLASAATVQADITHEQLAIEAGATFEGRSLRLKRGEKP